MSHLMRLCFVLLAIASLTACDRTAPVPASAPLAPKAQAEVAAPAQQKPQEEEGEEKGSWTFLAPAAAKPPVAADPALVLDDPGWDTTKRVKTELPTRRHFVTAPSAFLCPTKKGAATSCDSNIEQAHNGLVHYRGEIVSVLVEQSDPKILKAYWYGKPGTMPCWVDATKIAQKPDLTHIEALVKKHPRSVRIKGRDLTIWQHFETGDEDTPAVPTVLVAKVKGKIQRFALPSCLKMSGDPHQGKYMLDHSCIFDGECEELDYICEEKGGYCDEVVLVLDPEEKVKLEVPCGKKERCKTVPPARQVRALGDRRGVYEAGCVK